MSVKNRVFGWLGVLVVCASVNAGEPIAISDGPQLFLDDALISRAENVRRELQRPVKHPASPVLRPGLAWEDRALVYGTVLYDAETRRFRCWYLARREPRR